MLLSEGVYNSTLTENLTINRVEMEWGAPSVMSMVVFILNVLLGVPGNGAVIWVTGFKMKTSAHTVCFLNLAVADLMFCLCLPSFMVEITQIYSGESGNVPSSIFRAIMFLSAFASISLLCLISIYRCLAVTRPIWFRHHLSLAWVRATCFVVWVIVFSTWLPPFILHFPTSTVQILGAFGFGLPFVVMIICYAVVVKSLHEDRFAKSRKPIGLIVTAVAAFLICWLPLSLRILLPILYKNVRLGWRIFVYALASFSSALNPVIYVFVGSNSRQVFKRSLFASLQLVFTEQELQGETPNRNPITNRNV